MTLNVAELIGIVDRLGSLEPGKWMDVITVVDNPVEDLDALQQVTFVMKGGELYKRPAR